MAEARRRRRSAVPGALNYLSRVCIFVGVVCAPEFCVWKILCVVNVVRGWAGRCTFFLFFFFSLKTKNLSLLISWLH